MKLTDRKCPWSGRKPSERQLIPALLRAGKTLCWVPGSSLSHGCGVGENGVWWPRGGCSTGLPWMLCVWGESRQASEVGISACVWH